MLKDGRAGFASYTHVTRGVLSLFVDVRNVKALVTGIPLEGEVALCAPLAWYDASRGGLPLAEDLHLDQLGRKLIDSARLINVSLKKNQDSQQAMLDMSVALQVIKAALDSGKFKAAAQTMDERGLQIVEVEAPIKMWTQKVKSNDLLPASERDLAGNALVTQLRNLETACLRQGIELLNGFIRDLIKEGRDLGDLDNVMTGQQLDIKSLNGTVTCFFITSNLVKAQLSVSATLNVMTPAEQVAHINKWQDLIDAIVGLFKVVKQEDLAQGNKCKLVFGQQMPAQVREVLLDDGFPEKRDAYLKASRPVFTTYGGVIDLYSDARGDSIKAMFQKDNLGYFLIVAPSWLRDKLIPSYLDVYARRVDASQGLLLKPADHVKEDALHALFHENAALQPQRAALRATLQVPSLAQEEEDILKDMAKCVASSKDYHSLVVVLECSRMVKWVATAAEKLSLSAPSSEGVSKDEWAALQSVTVEITTALTSSVDVHKILKRRHLASDDESGAASVLSIERSFAKVVPAYVERVVIGIDNFIVKEIESRVPHAEWPAICSGHNLQKFAYCVLTSVHHNEASDIFWPAKTLDVDLQALVDRWEVPLPQALQQKFDAVKNRMATARQYFASVLGVMKIATEITTGAKSQGSKSAIKRECLNLIE